HQIFDVYQATAAEFRVEGAGGDPLPDLPLAHRSQRGDVEGPAIVDDLVAQRDHSRPKSRVARDGAELDQRLPLVGPGRSAGTVVAPEGFARDGHTARPAVGAQPEIDLEDALPSRFE